MPCLESVINLVKRVCREPHYIDVPVDFSVKNFVDVFDLDGRNLKLTALKKAVGTKFSQLRSCWLILKRVDIMEQLHFSA